jgi:tetratricopeptide (TPR) repeat protein
MNRLITTLLLTVLLLAANSCDRNYLGPDQQEIDSDDFFSNEDAFDRGALGIYQKLVFFYNYRGNAGNWLGLMRWLPDDDCTTQAGRAYEIFQSLNAADGLASAYYRFAYQLIARANTFIEKQDQLGDEVYNSQTLRDTHRGEALFLRGYMNFWLWNYFGSAAPLINDRITTQDGFFPPSSEGNQLLDQAIADFDAAKDLLPDSWPEAEIGRATRNSANGYLGRALLYRATVTGSQSDYTAAIQAFDRIQGASLMADFGDNFDETIENNAESIFEVQLGRNEATDNVWLSNDDFNVVGEISGYWGHFDNNFGQFGQARITVTDQLVSIFEAEDPRIEDTFEPGTNNVKKYVARPRTNGGNPNFYNNHRDLRYADVLLMKAEAIVQSGGNIPEAIGLVNQIRERARNSADSIPSTVPADLDVNVGSASEALDIIVEERRRELAVEGLRWFDLRRWHLGGIINIGDINFDSVRDDFDFDPAVHIYFPLPASQVTDNPNLRQNPGY